jgi:hypothetical protein
LSHISIEGGLPSNPIILDDSDEFIEDEEDQDGYSTNSVDELTGKSSFAVDASHHPIELIDLDQEVGVDQSELLDGYEVEEGPNDTIFDVENEEEPVVAEETSAENVKELHETGDEALANGQKAELEIGENVNDLIEIGEDTENVNESLAIEQNGENVNALIDDEIYELGEAAPIDAEKPGKGVSLVAPIGQLEGENQEDYIDEDFDENTVQHRPESEIVKEPLKVNFENNVSLDKAQDDYLDLVEDILKEEVSIVVEEIIKDKRENDVVNSSILYLT